MGLVWLLSSTFLPFHHVGSIYYHPPSFSRHLLCHLTIISWSISLFLPVPSNSRVYWYAIWQFDPFSAFSLEADGSQRYPNINETRWSLSNTPQTSWLVVFIIPPHTVQKQVPRQQSDGYSAPEPPTTAVPPQNLSAESTEELDCIASRLPLWMVAVLREEDGSPWSLAFRRCFFTALKIGGDKEFRN